MKKKIQNKLGTYLAVTAGVGCAASVAEGAIVVVDLSGLTVGIGNVTLPVGTGDQTHDISFISHLNFGFFSRAGLATFYSDGAGLRGVNYGRGYAGGLSAAFPADPDNYAIWNSNGSTNDSGFGVGENWVAFKDSSGKFGWMSFTLSSLGVNSTNPVSSFGKFVYDDTSTEPSNAITLQAAVAAAAIPEPSSLALLALGATGLLARRQRKQAA